MSKAVKTSTRVGAVYPGYRPPSREDLDNALRERLGKIYKPIEQALEGDIWPLYDLLVLDETPLTPEDRSTLSHTISDLIDKVPKRGAPRGSRASGPVLDAAQLVLDARTTILKYHLNRKYLPKGMQAELIRLAWDHIVQQRPELNNEMLYNDHEVVEKITFQLTHRQRQLHSGRRYFDEFVAEESVYIDRANFILKALKVALKLMK